MAKQKKADERCPNCGYCKHCGQARPAAAAPVVPYSPFWYHSGWWGISPPTTSPDYTVTTTEPVTILSTDLFKAYGQ